MAPPCKTPAAPAGAHSPPVSQQPTSRPLRELRAGLAVLQKPYSDAAARTATKHLEAAGGSQLRSPTTFASPHGVDSGTGDVLELLNQYLQWFLSGAPVYTTTSATSQCSSSSTHTGHPGTCSWALADGMGECLLHIASLVGAVVFAKTQGVAAGLRPHLVDANTGTFSLVGRAAALAIPIMQLGIAPHKLCVSIMMIWQAAGRLVDPALVPEMTNLSSSSSGGGGGGFDIWRQAPGMAQALPAVADMMHWWLQSLDHVCGASSSTELSRQANIIRFMLPMLVQQLQLLAEGAITLQQGGANTATIASSSSRGRSTAMVATPPSEGLFSPIARAQVERFLWHALATATASLEHQNMASLSSSLKTASSASAALIAAGADWVDISTGASSYFSSSQGATTKAASIKVPLPSRTVYKVQFDLVESGRASRQAAAALLQLATAGLPQQQVVKVTTAAAWLRQFQPPPPGLQDTLDLPIGSLGSIGLGVTSSSKEAQPALEAPGYLCWPIEGEAHNPPRSSSSSSSSNTPNSKGAPPNSQGRGGSGTRSLLGTMAGVKGPDPFANPGARLQLLAAAAAARWMDSQRRMSASEDPLHALMPTLADGGLGPSTDTNGLHALLHLLLLLVQQMQDAPLQYRNWFLNSRAGSAVLQMLGELRFGEAGQSDTGDWLVPGVTAPAAAAARRQQAPAKGDWQLRSVLCRVVVRKLLLPGLLLMPVPAWVSRLAEFMGSSTYSTAAGGSMVMLDLNKAKLVPLMLVFPNALASPGALRLSAGSIPPPAAFFLAEQLLREAPLATSLHMALSLLRGSASAVAEPKHQQQQTKKDPSSKVRADRHEEGLAEVLQLAYCSLAGSVVQAVVKKPALGAEYAGQVFELVAELIQAEAQEPAATGSSSGGGGSSSTGRGWGVAASLAAALAAGYYNAHLSQVLSDAAGRRAGERTNPSTSSSTRRPAAADPDYRCLAADEGTHDGFGGCCECIVAVGAFSKLCRIELGTPWRNAIFAPAMKATAERCGTTLHKHLQQQLLALAWRHPVPDVCGNVLCGQLEGPSAVGAVRGRRATLCGGCRAAWYCCEGCQRAAWAVHRVVCSKHTCRRRA